MEKIKDIKANIYSILSGVDYDIGSVKVYQNWPTSTASFPCVTFSVVNNLPFYAVEGELNYQDVEITINFWANTPAQASSMLADAELELRKNGYLMQSSEYLIEEDNTSHIYTIFKFII